MREEGGDGLGHARREQQPQVARAQRHLARSALEAGLGERHGAVAGPVVAPEEPARAEVEGARDHAHLHGPLVARDAGRERPGHRPHEPAEPPAPEAARDGAALRGRAEEHGAPAFEVEARVQRGRAPIHLVGHSLGAQVGIHFAHRYAERLAALVFIDPVYRQALQGLLGRVRRWAPLLGLLATLVRGLNRLGIRRRHLPYRDLYLLDVQTREILARSDEDIADLYMSPLADLKYIPWTIYLQELALAVRELPVPESVTVPVRVLLSAGATTSDHAVMRAILRRYPDCEVREIDADHWLLTEKPEEGRAAIESFCRQLAAELTP